MKLDGTNIGLAVVAGVGVLGFFLGVSAPPEPGRSTPVTASLAEVPPPPGQDWEAEKARLEGSVEVDREEALELRASRRAYDGAPPVVPHPVEDTTACLACHEEGLALRDKQGTAMPHGDLVSCTQCHVPSAGEMPGQLLELEVAANGFVGMESPGPGPRWGIAPPEVPHPTEMRQRCDSCHGPNGLQSLQSTHPERQECSQCHAAPKSAHR